MIRELTNDWMSFNLKIWPGPAEPWFSWHSVISKPRTNPATASTHTRERALGEAADCSDWNGHVSHGGNNDSNILGLMLIHWSYAICLCLLKITMVVWYNHQRTFPCQANATSKAFHQAHFQLLRANQALQKLEFRMRLGSAVAWKWTHAIENQTWFNGEIWRKIFSINSHRQLKPKPIVASLILELKTLLDRIL